MDGDSDSGSGSDSGSDWVEEEEGETRMTWVRQSTGHWEGELVLENQITHVWDPAAAIAAPTEIAEGAVSLQRLWKGYQARTAVDAAKSLLMLSSAS